MESSICLMPHPRAERWIVCPPWRQPNVFGMAKAFKVCWKKSGQKRLYILPIQSYLRWSRSQSKNYLNRIHFRLALWRSPQLELQPWTCPTYCWLCTILLIPTCNIHHNPKCNCSQSLSGFFRAFVSGFVRFPLALGVFFVTYEVGLCLSTSNYALWEFKIKRRQWPNFASSKTAFGWSNR